MPRHPIVGMLGHQTISLATITEEMVANYRETGDRLIGELLIKAHLHIVLTIAKRHSSPRHEFEELASVGFEALTQAVEWCGPHLDENGDFQTSRLTGNNYLTKYLASTVNYRVRDFKEQDRVAFIPGRRFREQVAQSENECEIRILPLVSLDDQLRAKREQPEPEFEEALNLAVISESERKVIDLRREGYRYQEISHILGLSITAINSRVQDVEERFIRLFG